MAICACCDRLRYHDIGGCFCTDSMCQKCKLCRHHCHCVPGYHARLHYQLPFPSDLSLPRGSDEERAFVAALAANPEDQTTRLVFADWMDEHGRTDEGALLRELCEAPMVAPFRVMNPWYGDDRTEQTLRVRRRIDLHAEAIRRHRTGGQAFPGVLVLSDVEAVIAGIDRWPVLPDEPAPNIRAAGPR